MKHKRTFDVSCSEILLTWRTASHHVGRWPMHASAVLRDFTLPFSAGSHGPPVTPRRHKQQLAVRHCKHRSAFSVIFSDPSTANCELFATVGLIRSVGACVLAERPAERRLTVPLGDGRWSLGRVSALLSERMTCSAQLSRRL